MTLPDAVCRALRDVHDTGPAVAAMTAQLDTLAAGAPAHVPGVPPEDRRALAAELCAAVGEDDHQLAKLMGALWRAPTREHRLLAAACADALGHADLKRLLRFLQKAEKRLTDAASCDALVAGCESHIRAHPDLFLREARNRLSPRAPLVRRLGLMVLLPLTTDPPRVDLDVVFDMLGPHVRDPEPLIREACVCVLREAFGRDATKTRTWIATWAAAAGADDMLARITAEFSGTGTGDSTT